MKLQARRGSHLPVLIKLFYSTTGPILEMGCGLFSTVFLFWACVAAQRRLVTMESEQKFYDWLTDFKNQKNKCYMDFHKIVKIDNWDNADLSENWGLAFVDHVPDDRRVIDIARLTHAEYVVVHDAEPREDNKRILRGHQPLSSIHKLFRYKYLYTGANPNTLILSNKHDLSGFHTIMDGQKPLAPTPKVKNIISESEMKKTHPGTNRRYTIDRALKEIYYKSDDPEVRVKLQYACTLVEYLTTKINEHDPNWLRGFYPYRNEFNTIMGKAPHDPGMKLRLGLSEVATDAYMREAAAIPIRNKRYPICMALGQAYTLIDDPVAKFKLRYALTLAQRITARLEDCDPGWLKNFYLRYKEYRKIERRGTL